MNILSLCDRTGNMVKPWVAAGHSATIVDVQHDSGRDGKLFRWGEDVTVLPKMAANRKWDPKGYDIIFAFPPCTDLAVSGARWFKEKGMRRLIDALEIVEACCVICEASGAPYMIENPVSTLSTYWREPDYMFDPCDYGGYLDPPVDAYTKKTCLWTGGGFIMPEPKRVDPTEGSKFHLTPPGPDRGNIRSVTPMGFAQAVCEANS